MLTIKDNKGQLLPEQKERLAKVSVAAICDGLEILGLVNGNALPGTFSILGKSKQTVVGLATTVYAPEGSSLPLHLAMFTHSEGRILIVATDNYKESAYLGDIQTLIASKKQCQGIIIDGYVRDAATLKESDLPVYCRGIVPNRPNKKEIGGINVDITIGEVGIKNGDIICADKDGVVIIPQEILEEAIIAAEEKERVDLERRNKAENFDYMNAKNLNSYSSIMTKDLQEYIKHMK